MQDKRFTWIHSGQTGAPQMDGVKLSEGQLLKVLDAGLVTGFNTQNAIKATSTASTVTLTYAAGHGYELRQLIEVNGATDTKLNGRHRVIEKTKETITLDAKGVTVFTGSIITKIAPLGFESMFGDTDPLKRAYRSANLQGTRTVLYLDASLPTGHGYNTANPSKRLMVNICQDMTVLGTQINSYTDAVNKKTTYKNGSLFWYQARPYTKTDPTVNVEFRPWVIVGNGDVFYLFNEWQDYNPIGNKLRDLYAFGDVTSLGGATDQYNCLWIGAITKNDADTMYQASTGGQIGGDIDTTPIGFFIKDHTGTGTLQNFVFSTDGSAAVRNTGHSAEVPLIPFPNPVSQSILGFPIYTLTKKGLRALMPRLLSIPQHIQNNIATYDLAITGNILTVAVFYSSQTSGIENGFYAIDLGD